MQKGFGQSHPDVVQYAYEVFQPEDALLQSVREYSKERGLPEIQVGAFDARHLEVLTAMTQARKVVEIGTLGGYSGICMLRAMGTSGHLHTFEFSPHHAEVARQNFERAGLQKQVDVHIGPALENLPRITKDAPFDLVFIDADKTNYPAYLNWATDHLRVGGVVLADNTFAWDQIHMKYGLKEEQQKAVEALRLFNWEIAHNGRYRATILPTSEGLTVGVKVR